MTDDAEAVDRLLQQMLAERRAEWAAADHAAALKHADHEGWMRGFREAARTGREHAWTLYLYGFITGWGVGAFLIMLLCYVTGHRP